MSTDMLPAQISSYPLAAQARQFLKLDAGNRTHAVAIACTRGLISLR